MWVNLWGVDLGRIKVHVHHSDDPIRHIRRFDLEGRFEKKVNQRDVRVPTYVDVSQFHSTS